MVKILYKAYDVLFQTVINAEDAEENSIDDEFRYQCLCCNKAVYLAAKDSIYKSAHFRHKRGDNDIIACDEYVNGNNCYKGNFLSSLYLDFYFHSIQKRFYATIRLSKKEILDYESKNLKLIVLGDKLNSPIEEISINQVNFQDNQPKEIAINRYSNVYIPKIGEKTHGNPQMLFSNHYPSVFKILGNDETEFIAKHIKSRQLYTNKKYFLIYNNNNFDINQVKKCKNIEILKNDIKFLTMRHNFKGIVIVIKEKNQETERIFKNYGFNIESSEKLLILWPPVCEKMGIKYSDSKNIYISSSFELTESGNTNSKNLKKVKIANNVVQIHIDNSLQIEKRNIKEKIIVDSNDTPSNDNITPIISKKTEYIAHNNNFFIFDSDGVRNLFEGEKVYLIDDTYIVEVDKNNYPIQYIYPEEAEEKSKQEILQDILKHYNVEIEYGGVPKSTNIYIEKYLSQCKENGKINKCVKKYIEEGIL